MSNEFLFHGLNVLDAYLIFAWIDREHKSAMYSNETIVSLSTGNQLSECFSSTILIDSMNDIQYSLHLVSRAMNAVKHELRTLLTS